MCSCLTEAQTATITLLHLPLTLYVPQLSAPTVAPTTTVWSLIICAAQTAVRRADVLYI